MVLTKNWITKCIVGHNFPLLDQAISKVIADKYALYEYCKLKNVPIIKHHILFNPNNKYGSNTNNLITKYYEEYHKDVVVKPNVGCMGEGVYHPQNKKELLNNIKDLFKTNFSISICPYYEVDREYRVIVLDNEIRLIFEKKKLQVKGNGIQSIKDLLIEENPSYFKDRVLDKSFNRILKKDEIYNYDWRFNLEKGATAKLVDDKEVYNKLSKFALEIANKLNIRFASIDIIKYHNKYFIMEINSSVCLNKICNFLEDNSIVTDIYRDVIKKMFNN